MYYEPTWAPTSVHGPIIENHNSNVNFASGHAVIVNSNPNLHVMSSSGATVNYAPVNNFNFSSGRNRLTPELEEKQVRLARLDPAHGLPLIF